MIYIYGLVFPVMPLKFVALEHILRLPCILQPSYTPLYSFVSAGVLKAYHIENFNLSKYIANVSTERRKLDLKSCTLFNAENY